jgi:D-alanine--poly(phosphoribitol) ligase subunit 1
MESRRDNCRASCCVDLKAEVLTMSSTVLDDIIGRAHDNPDDPAAKDLERELTYKQLIDEAGKLAAGLSDRGVAEGDRVALLIPNSVDFLVAALATLWVGAVFVPLAVTDPASRLVTIVSDCAPALVVVSTDGEGLPPSIADVPTVAMTSLGESGTMARAKGDGSARIAYMIYTSGTTGTPKGVQISNAAFAAAVHSTMGALGLSRATTTLCVSPFHFDGSYANLFPTLVAGGTVVIRPREALLFPRTFFNTVAQERITYAGFTPSYLRLLLASAQISSLNDATLDTIALGGEAVSVGDIRALWAHAPRLRVFNRYGPTETTIAVTNAELTQTMIDEGVITIGRPHPGVTFVLVDDGGRVVEESGAVGELYVGGAQLMAGYWANPELTSEVLRRDVVPDESLYRTGDLAYRDERGDYVYVDRVDRVVKRSGVRISLVELSESMNRLGEVEAAACLTFNRDGDLGIVAFVVVRGATTLLELRRAASQLIPENMLPDRFEFVSTLPLNRSNQLDESRLLSEAGLEKFRSPSLRT